MSQVASSLLGLAVGLGIGLLLGPDQPTEGRFTNPAK